MGYKQYRLNDSNIVIYLYILLLELQGHVLTYKVLYHMDDLIVYGLLTTPPFNL